jgi:hypothetical protein
MMLPITVVVAVVLMTTPPPPPAAAAVVEKALIYMVHLYPQHIPLPPPGRTT